MFSRARAECPRAARERNKCSQSIGVVMLGALRARTFSWRRGGLALLALLGLSFGGTASAQLNVLITKGIERPTPMAIVPFGWSGSGPVAFDIAGVVSADLKSSGRFAPIAESDMVSKPTQPDRVNFADW